MSGFRIPTMTKRVEFTNLAVDGSFEDVSHNWNCWLANPTDTSQAKDGSRSLKLGGDALASSMAAVSLIAGHKYYGREYIKTAGELTAADCRFELVGAVNGVEKAFIFGWNRGNYPDWTAISGIITSDGAYSFGLRTFTVGGSCSAWVDSIVVIDLTAACGAGNEPSKEWCDANIPFFSGSYTVDIPLNSPIQMPVAGLKIPIVPDGYTQLEYIESTGVQYLPSVTVPRDFKIEVTISAKTTGAYQNIFDNSAAQPMLWIDQNKQLELDINKTGYYMDDNKHHIVVDYLDSIAELYVDGVLVNSFSRVHINSCTPSMFNRFGAQCFNGKIYGFKVSDSNGTITECFPARRNSDGVVGVYDRINGAFYTNAGSGTFIAGSNGGGAVVTKITDASGRVIWSVTNKPTEDCIIFSSATQFSLGVRSPEWNGTMQFNNGGGWDTWNGSLIMSGVTNNRHYIRVRGIGNTIVSGSGSGYWDLNSNSGDSIECSGNIETLLDYNQVKAGNHPTMADNCFAWMFSGCRWLTTSPDLPATTLSNNCYAHMFDGCSALQVAPSLPAPALATSCYEGMFYRCTALRNAPKLPAAILADACYKSMFYMCSALTTIPALPAISLTNNCYAEMFAYCYLAVSATQTSTCTKQYRIPSAGSGTAWSTSLTDMFSGSSLATPSINTTFYIGDSITIV